MKQVQIMSDSTLLQIKADLLRNHQWPARLREVIAELSRRRNKRR